MSLSRMAYSGNLMVTISASRFGFEFAGVLKIAAYIADAIKSFFNALIGFSGGALFGTLKNNRFIEKKLGFMLLSDKVAKSILFILLIFLLTLPLIFYVNNIYSDLLTYATLFLLITLTDQATLFYVQFYTIEEKPLVPAILKLLELLFALVLIPRPMLSIFYIMLLMLIAKIISLSILYVNAYMQWRLLPHVRFSKK